MKLPPREVLIFSMAWMGTRDIIVALILTASFVILSDFLLNAKSNLCILPNKEQYIKVDTNKDGIITDVEINNANIKIKQHQSNIKKFKDFIEFSQNKLPL